jgi:hypothetical protein
LVSVVIRVFSIAKSGLQLSADDFTVTVCVNVVESNAEGFHNNFWDFVSLRFGPRIESVFKLLPGDATIFCKLTLSPGSDLLLSWPIDTFVLLCESFNLSHRNFSISIGVNPVEQFLK